MTTRSTDPSDIVGVPVITKDGSYTLRHPEHGECYHSFQGAFFEARELYIRTTGVLQAFAESGVTPVLDVGLGLGYNALATIEAWSQGPGTSSLLMASLEINGALVQALASGEATWQDGWSQEWMAAVKSLMPLPGGIWQAQIPHPRTGTPGVWRIYLGDAATTPLPRPDDGGWRFVWQDPFSPKKNPPLWDAEWFARLGKACAPQAILATYSVARSVKDALEASGWKYRMIATPTQKKAWLQASWNA